MRFSRRWIAGAVTVVAIGAMASPALGVGKGDVCVSIKGDVKVEMGSSSCGSSATSRAIAVNDSGAFAFGDNNTATAINDSDAFAGDGDNNTATAINESSAVAEFGNDQTVTVINGEQK